LSIPVFIDPLKIEKNPKKALRQFGKLTTGRLRAFDALDTIGQDHRYGKVYRLACHEQAKRVEWRRERDW
jgi:hypothetical protein